MNNSIDIIEHLIGECYTNLSMLEFVNLISSSDLKEVSLSDFKVSIMRLGTNATILASLDNIFDLEKAKASKREEPHWASLFMTMVVAKAAKIDCNGKDVHSFLDETKRYSEAALV